MLKIIAAILNLFDDSASGEASATNLDSTHQDSGDLTKVKYGKQPDSGTPDGAGPKEETNTTKTEEKPVDKSAAFLDLIRGEYKDQYAAETQKMINRRFAETKSLEEKLSKQDPLIQSLMQRYGTDDLAKLQDAINSDTDFLAEAAAKENMSVEQYKNYTQMKRENEILKAAQKQALDAQQKEAKLRRWAEESEALKGKLKERYGIDLDIGKEAENPDFAAMLNSGVSVETAYNAIHFSELAASSNQKAAKATEKAVMDNIRAKGNRPVEAGTSPGGAFTTKSDVNKLTKADRAEILRRAALGEVISF